VIFPGFRGSWRQIMLSSVHIDRTVTFKTDAEASLGKRGGSVSSRSV
jgi:hypothetical protein